MLIFRGTRKHVYYMALKTKNKPRVLANNRRFPYVISATLLRDENAFKNAVKITSREPPGRRAPGLAVVDTFPVLSIEPAIATQHKGTDTLSFESHPWENGLFCCVVRIGWSGCELQNSANRLTGWYLRSPRPARERYYAIGVRTPREYTMKNIIQSASPGHCRNARKIQQWFFKNNIALNIILSAVNAPIASSMREPEGWMVWKLGKHFEIQIWSLKYQTDRCQSMAFSIREG